jgi:NAD-dependent SIR2 family protein deacetylase
MANNQTQDYSKAINEAAQFIREADSIIIAAGAGMGVDSGLPDFRGDDGFWKAYPALGQAGIRFTEIANPKAFVSDPKKAWGFYGHRLDLYRRTRPHVGFSILKRWGAQLPHGCFVYTSNVDGQFQRSRFPAERIAECHGSIFHLQCSKLCTENIWPTNDIESVWPHSWSLSVDIKTGQLISPIPRCPNCGAVLRPNVLMFNDYQWIDTRIKTQLANLHDWLKTLQRPVIIELGAGNSVPTVRQFTARVSNQKQAALIRINPREFEVPSRASIGVPMGALSGLLAIDAVLHNQRPIYTKD